MIIKEILTKWPNLADLDMSGFLMFCLRKKLVNIPQILTIYTQYIENEKDIITAKFNESTVCLSQYLSGNFKGNELKEVNKRSIHILNENKTFPTGLYDDMYYYNSEDKEHYDKKFEMMYGINLSKN